MPIRDKTAYPKDWHEISKRVRADAGNKCQTCGVLNGAVICRSVCGQYWYDGADSRYSYHWPSGEVMPWGFDTKFREKFTKIVLTVAHIDHDPGNCDPSNLLAECQACHLSRDSELHQKNRKASRMARRAAGDLFASEGTVQA